jgi:uncharacterized lipoprotein YehR (DUF1307 family)
MKKRLHLVAILVVILIGCENKRMGAEFESEFDLVDYLLQYKYLNWEEDSMTFIYKGERYTSRYGLVLS